MHFESRDQTLTPRLSGGKIDFWGDPFFESAARFFVIILKYIFKPIIEFYEKKFLSTKIILVSKPKFHTITDVKLQLFYCIPTA